MACLLSMLFCELQYTLSYHVFQDRKGNGALNRCRSLKIICSIYTAFGDLHKIRDTPSSVNAVRHMKIAIPCRFLFHLLPLILFCHIFFSTL
jgi:hypothetical protein